MQAIILAAGINKRLQNSIDIPKCLLPLGKTTILENQINSLKKAGTKLEDILVVIGYKAEEIQKVHKNTLFNPKFAEFDNGYSVYLGLKHLIYEKNLNDKEKILILDGDLVYDENLIKDIVSLNKENVLVNRPIECNRELKDEISITNKRGKITRLIIPSKENPIPLSSYVGIAQISRNVATQLHEKLRNSHEKWYTLPFPELIIYNDFYSFLVPKSLKYCFDIDTKEDMEKLSNLK